MIGEETIKILSQYIWWPVSCVIANVGALFKYLKFKYLGMKVTSNTYNQSTSWMLETVHVSENIAVTVFRLNT